MHFALSDIGTAYLEEAAAMLHILLQHGRQTKAARSLTTHQLLNTFHLSFSHAIIRSDPDCILVK